MSIRTAQEIAAAAMNILTAREIEAAQEHLHQTSIKSKDLEPGACMGCGRRSHTAFCAFCLPTDESPARRLGRYGQRRKGRLPEDRQNVLLVV